MSTAHDVAHTFAYQAPGARRDSSDPTGRSLSPRKRLVVLAAHIVVSVGLLGIYAAMLILGTAAATTPDPESSGAAYRALGILRGVIPPAAGVVIVIAITLALGTRWGLFTHYWVVAKLGLTLAAVPVSILAVFPSIQQAIVATSGGRSLTGSEAGGAPLLLIAASGTIVLMLGAATVIGVHKPWGPIGRSGRPN